MEELTENVKALVHHAFTVVDKNHSHENQMIVRKRVKHKMNKEGTDNWNYGNFYKVVSQVRIQSGFV